MSAGMEQAPLRLALQSKAAAPGVYEIEFAPSVCFGVVFHGGMTASICHQAAVDFVSTLAKSSTHRHVLYFNLNFLRPAMAAPAKTTINFRAISASRLSTVLQVEISQASKLCSAGIMTMANLLAPGTNTLSTGWQLLPPPAPTSVASLQADSDPNWVGYLTPFSPKNARRPHSYLKWYVPRKIQKSYHIFDQWVTSGWTDNYAGKDRAVWTDELIHFVVDNVVPMINDLMRFPDPEEPGLHKRIVQAGLEQRQSRADGNSDPIWGPYLGEGYMSPYILSTISTSTEVKRALPEGGCKWLFMRVEVKAFLNDRLDHQIILMNENMELVAVSHQLAQAIPIQQKQDKKTKL